MFQRHSMTCESGHPHRVDVDSGLGYIWGSYSSDDDNYYCLECDAV
jgi:hypothetical protein